MSPSVSRTHRNGPMNPVTPALTMLPPVGQRRISRTGTFACTHIRSSVERISPSGNGRAPSTRTTSPGAASAIGMTMAADPRAGTHSGRSASLASMASRTNSPVTAKRPRGRRMINICVRTCIDTQPARVGIG